MVGILPALNIGRAFRSMLVFCTDLAFKLPDFSSIQTCQTKAFTFFQSNSSPTTDHLHALFPAGNGGFPFRNTFPGWRRRHPEETWEPVVMCWLWWKIASPCSFFLKSAPRVKSCQGGKWDCEFLLSPVFIPAGWAVHKCLLYPPSSEWPVSLPTV